MNKWFLGIAIGAALTLGMGTTRVSAQHGHEGHGHAAGEHEGHGNDGQAHGYAEHGDEGLGQAKSDTATSTPLCPVMGDPANLSVSFATDDGPVFVCCKGCIKKIKANPAKYATKVASQRKALAGRDKVQVTCPVSGEPVDPDVFVEVDGKKVNLCCMGCAGKYKKDPGAYKTGLANSYTYQTKCPVKGTEIDPSVSAKLANGQSIYLCCKGCEKKLFKNPGKYAKALTSQGYEIEASDLKPGK